MSKPKPAASDATPFDALRDFARRLLAVPKAEIDKREAEYQRQRKKARRGPKPS